MESSKSGPLRKDPLRSTPMNITSRGWGLSSKNPARAGTEVKSVKAARAKSLLDLMTHLRLGRFRHDGQLGPLGFAGRLPGSDGGFGLEQFPRAHDVFEAFEGQVEEVAGGDQKDEEIDRRRDHLHG